MTDPPDALDGRIAFLLQLATEAVQGAGERALTELGITGRQYGMLALSGRRPRSQVLLGAVLGLDRTTTMQLLTDLERRGLVDRRPDPANRRANIVTLTPSGDALRARAFLLLEGCERDFLADLDPDEQRLLRGLLQKLTHEPTLP